MCSARFVSADDRAEGSGAHCVAARASPHLPKPSALGVGEHCHFRDLRCRILPQILTGQHVTNLPAHAWALRAAMFSLSRARSRVVTLSLSTYLIAALSLSCALSRFLCFSLTHTYTLSFSRIVSPSLSLYASISAWPSQPVSCEAKIANSTEESQPPPRCRANMAHIKRSWPDFVLDFM